jgi:hypothetical protein
MVYSLTESSPERNLSRLDNGNDDGEQVQQQQRVESR